MGCLRKIEVWVRVKQETPSAVFLYTHKAESTEHTLSKQRRIAWPWSSANTNFEPQCGQCTTAVYVHYTTALLTIAFCSFPTSLDSCNDWGGERRGRGETGRRVNS